MDRVVQLLLPTGMGIALILLISINSIIDEGFRAARGGTGELASFLEGFIELMVLMMVVLLLFGAIRGAFE